MIQSNLFTAPYLSIKATNDIQVGFNSPQSKTCLTSGLFVCTSDEQVGLQWKTLQDLSELVDQLFCVRTVTMEQLSDRFLSDVIKLVLDGRTSTRQETMNKVLELFHDLASTEDVMHVVTVLITSNHRKTGVNGV